MADPVRLAWPNADISRTAAEFAHFQQQAAIWRWDALLHIPSSIDLTVKLPPTPPVIDPDRQGR